MKIWFNSLEKWKVTLEMKSLHWNSIENKIMLPQTLRYNIILFIIISFSCLLQFMSDLKRTIYQIFECVFTIYVKEREGETGRGWQKG